MTRLALLGDSIFDNGLYVGDGPDVIAQLRGKLPPGWAADLLAIDGDVCAGVPEQLERVNPEHTHLVVSVGGNDLLLVSAVFTEGVERIAEAVARLADLRDAFAAAYQAMLGAVLARELPTLLCTVYEPRFEDPFERRISAAALTLFNDVIRRAAYRAGLPLLDLVALCDDDADFANPIEPSCAGGDKISDAILAIARDGAWSEHKTYP